MIKSSTILTCIGAVGVVATSILTAKATPKAIALLDKATKSKGEPLTKLETVKVAGPAYIPAMITGVSTLACIFGANVLNTRNQAALTSAYALLDNSYKEYRRKVSELYGEEADSSVIEEVAKDSYDESVQKTEGEQLFLDFNTLRYFNAPMEEVVQKVTMDDGLECYVICTPFAGVADF